MLMTMPFFFTTDVVSLQKDDSLAHFHAVSLTTFARSMMNLPGKKEKKREGSKYTQNKTLGAIPVAQQTLVRERRTLLILLVDVFGLEVLPTEDILQYK